jgi:ATP-binding cassette subfamily B protein
MQRLPNQLMPFFWHFIKKQPVAFAILFLAPLTTILEHSVMPYGIKMIIDAISAHTGDRSDIFTIVTPALWIYGGAWILALAIYRFQNWLQGYTIPKFQADIRLSTIEWLSSQSNNYFMQYMAGDLSNKISDLSRAIESIRLILTWNIIATFVVTIAALIFMAVISPISAVVLGIWVVVQIIVIIMASIPVYHAAEVNAEHKSTLSGHTVDMLSNINTVRLFSHKSNELSYLGKAQDIENESHKRLIMGMNNLRLWLDIPVTILLAALLYVVIKGWQENILSVGDAVFIVYGSLGVLYQVWFLGNILPDFFREIGTARQALKILMQPHTMLDDPSAKPLVVKNGLIEFKDVTFNYNRNNNIFKNKNVTLEAGKKVGLVGFSGSGKTTFVNLITRFFDIESGQIAIDGQNIAKVTQDSLRNNISMIPQDTSLFHRSLMENIRYGRSAATDLEVIEASKRAHCHEFISKLEHGYDTLVGDRGIKLSGGQRQRIAIARAILKDAAIIILDEATSALDSVTEKHIQESLHELMEGHTTIVIAHRLSTLGEMDRILVFDKGNIIEDGTHKQLIKLKGHYAKMWQMQAGGFLPEAEA